MSVTQASTSEAALERIKRFYNSEICFERELVVKSLKITMYTTFLFGGLAGRQETNRRLQVHTTSVTFASPSSKITRSWDYKMLSFMKNGFRWSFRATTLIGALTMGITHLTLYRDRFSGWYSPTIAGSVSFIAHRACGLFALPLGFYGSLQAATLGTFIGSTISATAYLYALYVDGSIDDAYRSFRTEYEKELQEIKDYQTKVTKIMKERDLWFPIQARRYLRNMKEDETLGNLDDYDESEQNQQAEVQPKK